MESPLQARGSPFPKSSQARKRTRVLVINAQVSEFVVMAGTPVDDVKSTAIPCYYARDVKKRGRKPTSHSQRSGDRHQDDEQLQSTFGSSTPRSVPEDTPLAGDSSPDVRHQWHPTAPSTSESQQSLPPEDGGHSSSHQQHDVESPKDLRNVDAIRFEASETSNRPFLPPLRRPSNTVRRISQIINSPLPSLSESAFLASPEVSFSHPVKLASLPNQNVPSQLTAYSTCRYKCVDAIMPFMKGIVDQEVACTLIEYYFIEPDSSLFRSASPYVLTHVLRKRALLDANAPRQTTSSLLVTMLWVSAQTADIPALLLPGARGHVCEELRKLAMALFRRRDRDHWNRFSGGSLTMEDAGIDIDDPDSRMHPQQPLQSPEPVIDDVLTLILLSIVISGGDFKTDCFKWWSKAVRLAEAMVRKSESRCICEQFFGSGYHYQDTGGPHDFFVSALLILQT